MILFNKQQIDVAREQITIQARKHAIQNVDGKLLLPTSLSMRNLQIRTNMFYAIGHTRNGMSSDPKLVDTYTLGGIEKFFHQLQKRNRLDDSLIAINDWERKEYLMIQVGTVRAVAYATTLPKYMHNEWNNMMQLVTLKNGKFHLAIIPKQADSNEYAYYWEVI